MAKRIRLGAGGPEVSRLAYGCWRLADDPDGTGVGRVRAKIDACLAEGITTFDHADLYGGFRSEELFGAALRESPGLRDQIELITKCGIRPAGDGPRDARVKHYDLGRAHLVGSVERSLRALATDRIDVLLLHRPSPMMDPDETAAALAELRGSGKVLHVGGSNFKPAQLELLQGRLDFPLVTNQVEVSLLATAPFLDGTFDQCLQRRITPMAWSPMAGGRLFAADDERALRVTHALEALAPGYGVSPEALAYAWLLVHPSRMVVILGTNRPGRVRDAARAVDVALSLEDWFALWQASTGREVP